MHDQEVAHLERIDALIPRRRVRPTALLPLWHIAGFALGAGTALLGRRAAMACTVAVEEAIISHYNDQLRTLHEERFSDETLLREVESNIARSFLFFPSLSSAFVVTLRRPCGDAGDQEQP